MVAGVESDDPLCPVGEVEHERGVEIDEVAGVAHVETAGRVCEADVGHGARRIRPPRVDGPVGPREVGGEVAEEVEGHRRRPQELGPQSLVIEALVGSMNDVRALAALSAAFVRKVAPVSMA